MEERIKPVVLITGVNGYIGSWVCYKALEEGKYKVCATLREITEDKKAPLVEGFGQTLFDQITFYKVNLNDADSIEKAIEESNWEYVIHIASQFVLESPKDERDIIDPAVNGTLSILEASFKCRVKRVVITSACATMEDFTKGDIEVDENYWPDIEGGHLTPYYKSKILAEKAAWDFYDKLDEEEKEDFEIVVINPSFSVGPLKVRGEGTSQKLITGLMDGTLSSFPHCYTWMSDVRDVADAHIKALTCESNRRYPIVEGTYSFYEITKILQDLYNQHEYKVSYSPPSKFFLWIGSIFSKDSEFFLQRWGVKCVINTKTTKEKLGMEFIDIKTSLKEMVESLIKLKFIQEK